MKINIESIHFKIDKKLELLINEKINKLTEHHTILNSDVILKIGTKPQNKIIEVKLNCQGCNFHSEKNSETFEHSITMVTEALRRQLQKHKTKTILKNRYKKDI